MPDSSLPRLRPVWLASYPRSGNTFLRIILQNMFRLPTYSIYRVGGEEVYDPSADALDQAPFLPPQWRSLLASEPEAKLTPIKTHGFPEDPAPAIYVVRDGRAAIDSYFHYHKKFAFEQPPLTEIIAGACQFGSWSDHYFAWQPRARPNTLLLRYEELIARPAEAIACLSEFLKLEPAQGRIPTFEELRQRFPAFFRRGQNEDFKTQWTPDQVSLFNQLHGSAMAELGYTLSPTAEPVPGVTLELARGAARLHRLYLEQLHNQAAAQTAALGAHQESSTRLSQLSAQVDELSARLSAQTDAAHKLSAQVEELSGRLSAQTDISRQLTARVDDLSARLSAKTIVHNQLLHRRWVKLGLALHLLRPPVETDKPELRAPDATGGRTP